MPLPGGDDFRTTLFFTGINVPTGAAVTCDWQYIGGGTPSITDFNDAFISQLEDVHKAIASEGCFLSEYLIKQGPEATGPSQLFPVAFQGDQGNDAESPQTALLVRKINPAFSSRLGGRFFYPSVSAVGVGENGLLDPSYVDQIQAELDTLYAIMFGSDYQLAVNPTVPGSTRAMTGFSVQSRVATQRRRNRR